MHLVFYMMIGHANEPYVKMHVASTVKLQNASPPSIVCCFKRTLDNTCHLMALQRFEDSVLRWWLGAPRRHCSLCRKGDDNLQKPREGRPPKKREQQLRSPEHVFWLHKNAGCSPANRTPQFCNPAFPKRSLLPLALTSLGWGRSFSFSAYFCMVASFMGFPCPAYRQAASALCDKSLKAYGLQSINDGSADWHLRPPEMERCPYRRRLHGEKVG